MCFILIDWICMDIFLCISLSILRGAVPKPNAYMKMLVGIFAWALLNKTGHFVSLVLLTGLDWDQFITKSWTQKGRQAELKKLVDRPHLLNTICKISLWTNRHLWIPIQRRKKTIFVDWTWTFWTSEMNSHWLFQKKNYVAI